MKANLILYLKKSVNPNGGFRELTPNPYRRNALQTKSISG